MEKVNCSIKVVAINPYTNNIIDKTECKDIPADRIQGSMALVADAGYNKKDPAGFSFSEWKVNGSKIRRHSDWNIGPIIGAQYTLSRNTLKITAQLMPLGDNDNQEVFLEMKEGEKWIQKSYVNFIKPSYTAHFRINGWIFKDNVDYRLGYKLKSESDKAYYLYGIIKHDPVEKRGAQDVVSLVCRANG